LMRRWLQRVIVASIS